MSGPELEATIMAVGTMGANRLPLSSVSSISMCITRSSSEGSFMSVDIHAPRNSFLKIHQGDSEVLARYENAPIRVRVSRKTQYLTLIEYLRKGMMLAFESVKSLIPNGCERMDEIDLSRWLKVFRVLCIDLAISNDQG